MIYCYVCECGKETTEEHPAKMAEYRPECECGKTMERDWGRELKGGHMSSCWPMWSVTGGCHPDQVGEWKKALNERGVDADFRKDGSIKWESQRHRKRCCEALGMFDRNGGYGDPRKP